MTCFQAVVLEGAIAPPFAILRNNSTTVALLVNLVSIGWTDREDSSAFSLHLNGLIQVIQVEGLVVHLVCSWMDFSYKYR